MIARALDTGAQARSVAGDEVYDASPALRADLQARELGYVLAIGCDSPASAVVTAACAPAMPTVGTGSREDTPPLPALVAHGGAQSTHRGCR